MRNCFRNTFSALTSLVPHYANKSIVIGGYLAQAKGWRWLFWIQVILSGTTLLGGLIFLKETYAVVLLEKKATKLRKETGDEDLVSVLHDKLSRKDHFTRAIVRPMKMLLFSPIVMLLSLYIAVLFGYLYLFVTTFPMVFSEQYQFGTGSTGLTYLGLGVGCFLGLIIAGKGSDILYKRLENKHGGSGKPEFRLPILGISAPLVAISFFWYGWSAEAKIHWIVPILGTVLFGMGMMPAFVSHPFAQFPVAVANECSCVSICTWSRLMGFFRHQQLPQVKFCNL